jgi:hypothetical protein
MIRRTHTIAINELRKLMSFPTSPIASFRFPFEMAQSPIVPSEKGPVFVQVGFP